MVLLNTGFSPQEKNPWLQYLHFNVSLLNTSLNVTDAKIKIDSVSFMKTTWKIDSINFSIVKASLAQTKLFFYNTQDKVIPSINILSSTFGLLHASDKYYINVSHCYIDGEIRQNLTLIYTKNCYLEIRDSSFYDRITKSGSSIVKAIGSTVNILDTQFGNNTSEGGIINILNGSSLH